jgi:uncharacterized protein (TIGR03435 family)
MRAAAGLISLMLVGSPCIGQASFQRTSFDVASVKPSEQRVGPDYNNRLTFSGSGFRASHATLRRLVAEADQLQLNQVIGQVIGPAWLDQNEYDIEAKAGREVPKQQMLLMLRFLLADRFALKEHPETRNLRAYDLVVDKQGFKLQAAEAGAEPTPGRGFHFHGDMRQLADLIAVQLSIPEPTDPGRPAVAGGPPAPVLDKTGLPGIYDFDVDVRPEPGADGFVIWQRMLQDRLGLKLENRREDVPVIVVDSALPTPTPN